MSSSPVNPDTRASPSFLRRDAPCSVCGKSNAKYTCPRCATRTCSLDCSKSHKANANCNGERDRTRFVPVNAYGFGTLMDDYVYLEDMGRKVSQWGDEIARGGLSAQRGQVAMRGRAKRGQGGQFTKRDQLKLQLEARDIDVDLLPPKMQRRNLNQSTWDSRKQTALLTIEFALHPPAGVDEQPYTLLTHRNDFHQPLLDLLRSHLLVRTKSSRARPPEWVTQTVFPDSDAPDTFVAPECFLPVVLDTLAACTRAGFRRLDPAKPLATLLRGQHFVEFATIAVCEPGSFRGGTIVDEAGVTQEEEAPRPAKRRKIDVKAVEALFDGYGSGSEEEKLEATTEVRDSAADTLTLAPLSEYQGGSDMEGVDSDAEDAEQEDEGTGEEDEAPGPVDYAALLDLMRQAKETGASLDDEAIDWGDSEDEAG